MGLRTVVRLPVAGCDALVTAREMVREVVREVWCGR